MKPTFLTEIEKLTLKRVGERKKLTSLSELKTICERGASSPARFLTLLGAVKPVFIAEVKKQGPSLGELNLSINPARLAQDYFASGASAVSVLTEPHHFKGSLQDLIDVRALNPNVPILQKDFVIDEYQIYEAMSLGADAILLIVSLLSQQKLEELTLVATKLGLSVLVEVHDLSELQTALRLGSPFIGINNRNLHSLEVSLDVSRNLISHVPQGTFIISESGIRSPQECQELSELGFKGFLIGSSFMTSADPAHTLKEFIHAS